MLRSRTDHHVRILGCMSGMFILLAGCAPEADQDETYTEGNSVEHQALVRSGGAQALHNNLSAVRKETPPILYPVTNDMNDATILQGRALFEVVCAQCHSPYVVQIKRDGQKGWRETVESMILYGAQLDRQDTASVVAFLSTEYGPAAGAMALELLPPNVTHDNSVEIVSYPDEFLPEGEGKDFLVGYCQSCHDLGRVVSVRRSAHEWRAVSYNMINRLFSAPPEDIDKIAAYLTEHFGERE